MLYQIYSSQQKEQKDLQNHRLVFSVFLALLQKRLKKEKKVRRKLQEQTETADPGKSVLNSESSAVLSPESLRNAIGKDRPYAFC